jgi:hypothetical protein
MPPKPMTAPKLKTKSTGGRQLTSSNTATPDPQRSSGRYDFVNAGPLVRKKGGNLAGKIVNVAARRSTSLEGPAVDRPLILSNVAREIRLTGSEASVSGITSAAEQFNSYRFDESSALKTYKKMMTLHLKDEMFRRLKFITCDAMMEFSRSHQSLCGYVCTKMRVPDFQWGEYWELVRHTTKKMIEQQRTNATSAIKKGFKGKSDSKCDLVGSMTRDTHMTCTPAEMLSCTDPTSVESMPVTPDTLTDRYEEDNFPVYKDFISFFVSGVVGIRYFDRNKCHKHLRKYVSVSDEAFTVLTLENNWTRWSCMARRNEWKDSDVPSVWTTTKDTSRKPVRTDDNSDTVSDNEDTPQARRYRGWSAQGIARYNQLFTEIEMEREKDTYLEFEKYCMAAFQEEAEADGKTKHKRKRTEPDRKMPVARHQLWDEDVKEAQPDKENEAELPFGLKATIVEQV